MTLTTRIAWDDTVLPFQLDRSDIRGRVARLDTTLEQILEAARLPARGRGAGGRDGASDGDDRADDQAALETVVAGARRRADPPDRHGFLRALRGRRPGRIRAFASYDAAGWTPGVDPFSQTGKGYFAILIDQGSGMRALPGDHAAVGRVAIRSCAETYFAQSEQLPTRFMLGYGQSQPAR
jgi:molecular chaperone Hsp33